MAKHPRWTRTWACIEHYQIQWKKLADLIACVVCASCWPIMLCLGQKHALSLPDLGQLLTLVACRTSLTPSRYESALDFAWPPYSLPSLLVASRSIAPLFFCSFLSSIWCMFWLLFFIFIFFFFFQFPTSHSHSCWLEYHSFYSSLFDLTWQQSTLPIVAWLFLVLVYNITFFTFDLICPAFTTFFYSPLHLSTFFTPCRSPIHHFFSILTLNWFLLSASTFYMLSWRTNWGIHRQSVLPIGRLPQESFSHQLSIVQGYLLLYGRVTAILDL